MNNLTQLKGSSKQIAWAEDIRQKILDLFQYEYNLNKSDLKDTGLLRRKKMIMALEQIDDSKFFIENQKIAIDWDKRHDYLESNLRYYVGSVMANLMRGIKWKTVSESELINGISKNTVENNLPLI